MLRLFSLTALSLAASFQAASLSPRCGEGGRGGSVDLRFTVKDPERSDCVPAFKALE